ncbi:MAG: four-carbon acid sugar kinase family protein [Lysobacteraceae bacterium]|nr:MAG: four-carbon acid sugar kinase family protein [Xanthomonadaceae bacterium]
MGEDIDVVLGCIADDLTGASDLANELVGKSLRTVQTIGVPASGPAPDVDAIVISLKSRSVDPTLAIEQSVSALRWLRKAGCDRFYFKYCSTFDSTARGNIGPVLEALAKELATSAVVVCPAFPATGRTVYQGHLFVGDRLLNESGMQNHPLTPMTDADLVRVLQGQMAGRVSLLPHPCLADDQIGEHMAILADAGATAVIADAINDVDLGRLGAYCATVPFSSGGSGLGAGIAQAIAGPDRPRASAVLPAATGGRAIVAGSCSLATQRQVAIARDRYPSLRVSLDDGASAAAIVTRGRKWIDEQLTDTPILIYSTAAPEEVARQRNLWSDDASAVLEHVLSELTAHLINRGVSALVVAGGETSGAVMQRSGCRQLAIGPEIDPGVPWTIGLRPDGSTLLLALKSGNFGSDDFMVKAWNYLT